MTGCCPWETADSPKLGSALEMVWYVKVSKLTRSELRATACLVPGFDETFPFDSQELCTGRRLLV